MNESCVKQVIVLNHDFFEDYLRRYKNMMDSFIKYKVEGLIVTHKNLMLHFGVTEEDMIRHDPDRSEKCFVCDMVFSNLGERVIHVMEHIRDDVKEIVDYNEIVNIVRWLVAYGNYMNAVVKNVPEEERLPLVAEMTRCMTKLVDEENES